MYLWRRARRIIAAFEKKRGSRVIVLIHRQETMSLLGFPLVRYIDINDSEQIIRAIHMTDPDVPLDIVIHTPVGLVLAAVQIACAVRFHRGRVTVFVPHYAFSGGTLIALAADEIVMQEHAVLGPVDPQLGEYPAASLIKLQEAKPVKDIEDKSWLLADIGRKAIEQIKEAVRFLLKEKYPPERVEELSNILTEGRWTHDYPITYDEAKKTWPSRDCGHTRRTVPVDESLSPADQTATFGRIPALLPGKGGARGSGAVSGL